MFPERRQPLAADREAAEAELAKQLKAQKQSDKEDKSNDPHHWTAYIRRHSEGRYPWHRSSARLLRACRSLDFEDRVDTKDNESGLVPLTLRRTT